jgi:colanic acid biosynthesis glycosyl transferase WcaI
MKSLLYIEQFIVNDGWTGTEIPCSIVNDLAADLFDVTVVTGDVPYLYTNIPIFSLSSTIKVYKCFSFVKSSKTFFYKLINSYSFSFSLLFYFLILKRPDIVVCQTNPPQLVLLVSAYCKLFKIPFCLVCMDLYPEIFFAKWKSIPSPISSFLRFFFSVSYINADKVISLGRGMSQRLIKKGVDPAKIFVIPNWALGLTITETSNSSYVYRQFYGDTLSRYGCPDKNHILLYSGNLGVAHDWNTLAHSLSHNSYSNINTIIVSRGIHISRFRQYSKKYHMANLRFYDPVPINELINLFSIASLGIVTLDALSSGVVVPSKFASLLSRGIPVLYIGPNSDISDYINEFSCGFHFANFASTDLSVFLQSLDNDEINLHPYSINAYNLYKKLFSKTHALSKYRSVLSNLSS